MRGSRRPFLLRRTPRHVTISSTRDNDNRHSHVRGVTMIAVRRRSLLATFLALAVSTSAGASDELARAKDLYRSAAYDEALTALDQIAAETSGAAATELK